MKFGVEKQVVDLQYHDGALTMTTSSLFDISPTPFRRKPDLLLQLIGQALRSRSSLEWSCFKFADVIWKLEMQVIISEYCQHEQPLP